MSSRSPEESKSVLTAFHKGLREAGLVEGTNVAVEISMDGDADRIEQADTTMVRLRHEPGPPMDLANVRA